MTVGNGMAGEHRTKFDRLVEQVSDSIAIHRGDGELVYLSPGASRLLGRSVEELLADSAATRVHPDDIDHLGTAFLRWMRRPGVGQPVEYRLAHADGHWVHVESVGNNRLTDPDIAGVVVTTRDISDRKRLEQELTHRAMHDALTGLPNRALLDDRLGRVLATRDRSPTALLFIDLDRFKVVNDSLGHAAGDRLLVVVATRLQEALRVGDTLARVGGDEFVVLCPDASATEAAFVAERITQALERPVELPDAAPYHARASIGIVATRGGETAAQLLSAADAAMYHAKALGGGCYHVLDEATRTTTRRELQMETELAQALDRCQIDMHHQPIVSLEDGSVTGAEALMRWQHPDFGAVEPAVFIPLAERSGTIVALGRWALDQAVQHAVSWHQTTGRPFEIAVNLSGRQLIHPGFLVDLERAVGHPGLASGAVTLCLEVTESVLVPDAGHIVEALRLARALGCRIAIDDVGTGYSSFDHLRHLAVDILKIDRACIAGMMTNPTDRVLVESILNLARCLDLDVVAEGVEHADQAALLRELGCPTAQGFLWSRPVPSSGFLRAVSNQAALDTPPGGPTDVDAAPGSSDSVTARTEGPHPVPA